MDLTSFSLPELSPPGTYATTLGVLNRQSVQKHYDPYADIEWERPEHRIDPVDEVWELRPNELISNTAWYRSLPTEHRRRFGLDLICNFMRVGEQFENTLVTGLLTFARNFPDEAPERRYAMHEAVEECHHIQMFREFLSRTGQQVTGLRPQLRALGQTVVELARVRPALFFVFVLGGEDPIDFVQRQALREERPLHPLLRRIMQIHVTEEARHLCFARMYIGEQVKTWSSGHRRAFGLASAPILNLMSHLMLYPTESFIARHRIPRAVLREAYSGERYREQKLGAVAKIRDHFRECGIMTRDVEFVWRQQGLA